jgi:hypothetical protein
MTGPVDIVGRRVDVVVGWKGEGEDRKRTRSEAAVRLLIDVEREGKRDSRDCAIPSIHKYSWESE